MAVKYTNVIFVILMIKLVFFYRILCNFFLKGKKAQQQYIQGFLKKKPCQRQVDEVQCRSEPIHPAGASRPAN